MKVINTNETTANELSPMEREWVYNGLDTCVTYEVLEALLPQLDEVTSKTYEFSLALQGPVLDMRLRGVMIDQERKADVIEELFEKISVLEHNLERIVLDGLGLFGFNWRSNNDLQHLFYHQLSIPPILNKGRPTVNRTALEKLSNYFVALPFVNHIIAIRELAKKIAVLRQEIDSDGRIRTSYNIAGTSTGRFSSSFSEFGTGGNLQNIEESLRSILIADPKMKFAKFDAKSGESFIVGAIEWNLFGDDRYLVACESGDPHTAVAKICWPTLPWTGDLKKDKAIAEEPFYRHYTYRFMCKKLGHGSNYGGMPKTLSEQTKLPLDIVTEFQPRYFKAFPAHREWQNWVDQQIRINGTLTTLTGRRRQFWGRRNDPDTLREAIAYDPQGSLADIVNRAMLRIWRKGIAIVMLQDHDALTFMYPEKDEDSVVPVLQSMLSEDILLNNGRILRIPYDCKVGWNKGDFSATNPDGLKDYTGHDERKRSPVRDILDRKWRKHG